MENIINKFNKMKKYIEDLLIKMKSIKENKLIYKNNMDNNYKDYIKYFENKYIIKNFLYLIFIFFNKKIKKFIPFFQKLFFVTIF